MPVQPTKKQEEIFSNLSRYLCKRGHEYSHYTGENDNSYAFGKPIRCYLQYISVRAWKRPKESVMVVVKQNQKNEINKNFEIGNYTYGKSRHVFVIPNDQKSYDKALKLINTI